MFKQFTLVLTGLVAAYMMPLPSMADDDHFFLKRHPKLRRTFKAAGIGVLTGGLAAPLLGHSVASGAALGAGKGAAVHTWRERKKQKRIRSNGY